MCPADNMSMWDQPMISSVAFHPRRVSPHTSMLKAVGITVVDGSVRGTHFYEDFNIYLFMKTLLATSDLYPIYPDFTPKTAIFTHLFYTVINF